MTKARILRYIERGLDAIALFAAFQVLVAAGYIAPATSVGWYVVVAVISAVVSGIVSAERESAEKSK